MLPGFHDITRDLTEDDKKLIPLFVKGFSHRRAPEMAISNREMVEAFGTWNIKITEVKVRKIINYIRVHNLIPGLIATSSGYYVSDKPDAVQKYIKSLIGRENEIRKMRMAMQEHLKSITYRKAVSFQFREALQ